MMPCGRCLHKLGLDDLAGRPRRSSPAKVQDEAWLLPCHPQQRLGPLHGCSFQHLEKLHLRCMGAHPGHPYQGGWGLALSMVGRPIGVVWEPIDIHRGLATPGGGPYHRLVAAGGIPDCGERDQCLPRGARGHRICPLHLRKALCLRPECRLRQLGRQISHPHTPAGLANTCSMQRCCATPCCRGIPRGWSCPWICTAIGCTGCWRDCRGRSLARPGQSGTAQGHVWRKG